MRTPSEWYEILVQLQVKPGTAAKWAETFAQEMNDFSAGDADVQAFLGQVLHESAMLERLEENLNYSATRMAQVWPTRFARTDEAGQKIKDANGLFVPNDAALACDRNPPALANKVYGGRLGNKDAGDGWKYRGRGLIQITGRDNYRVVGGWIDQDLEASPDLLTHPTYALRASVKWWENRIPDNVLGDTLRVTKLVNGGTVGIEHRRDLTDAVGDALA